MRLIDAEVLENWIDGSQRLDTEHDYEEVARYIEECPTVDAVPVVRCRDCKYWQDGGVDENGRKVYPYCCFYDVQRKGKDFCSRGERKGGDE